MQQEINGHVATHTNLSQQIKFHQNNLYDKEKQFQQ